jgi:hypothetical protein
VPVKLHQAVPVMSGSPDFFNLYFSVLLSPAPITYILRTGNNPLSIPALGE